MLVSVVNTNGVIDCNEWKREFATNAQIWVEQNDSNYDGSCTSRHIRSGTYEISGLLISVGQYVLTAYTAAHCGSRQTKMLFSSGLWTSIT